MIYRSYFVVVLIGVFTFGLVSCNDTNPFERLGDFDQQFLLTNYGDSLIIPAYTRLNEEVEVLNASILALSINPSIEHLTATREQLKQARLSWQSCAMYSFGPAETFGLTAALNIYPVDQVQISQNISSGTYDLNQTTNVDARGFPCLEYLLYSADVTDEEILFSLQGNRAKYLTDVAENIHVSVTNVLTDWTKQGGYQGTFKSAGSIGIDPGSSVAKMVNAFIRDLERNTRDGKIGIPVGIRSLGEPLPESLESPLAGYSLALLKENVQAYQIMFMGGSGTGFDDYLRSIGAVSVGNEPLEERINNQFAKVIRTVESLQEPMRNTLETNPDQVQLVFVELQVLITILKTDFASAIGVSISYQDSDGD